MVDRREAALESRKSTPVMITNVALKPDQKVCSRLSQKYFARCLTTWRFQRSRSFLCERERVVSIAKIDGSLVHAWSKKDSYPSAHWFWLDLDFHSIYRMDQLSSTETLSLAAITLASGTVLWNAVREGEPLISSIAMSGLAFTSAFCLIRWLGSVFMRAGLKGKDMSKPKKLEIPETMGAVCAVVYLITMILFVPLPFYYDIVAATSGGGNKDVVLELERIETGRLLHKFPHSKVCLRMSVEMQDSWFAAWIVSVWNFVFAKRGDSRNWRRPV